MCGRARLPQDYSEIKRRIKFADDFPALNLRPSWNIAPTQDLLCAVSENGKRKPVLMHWGFIPSHASEFKMDWKYKTFNAVGETLEEKRTFLPAWVAGRRCLVITDGFYEWCPIDKKTKQAWAIGRADGDLMVMAGLWEPWSKGSETRYSCTIITTPANAAMRPVHHRMPVVLAEKDWPVWLGEESGDPAALMAPCANEDLKMWKVGPEVGKSSNDGAQLVAAI